VTNDLIILTAPDGLLPPAWSPQAPHAIEITERPRVNSVALWSVRLQYARQTLETDFRYLLTPAAAGRASSPAFRRAQEERWERVDQLQDKLRLWAIRDVLCWQLFGDARHDEPAYFTLASICGGDRAWQVRERWPPAYHLRLPVPREPSPPRLTSLADSLLKYALGFPAGSPVTLSYQRGSRIQTSGYRLQES